MKLVKLILKNFRAYKGYHEIEIGDLTAIMGRNDIGKSTILEALDILLEGGLKKFDVNDINKYKDKNDECIIGAEFTNLPESITIDTDAITNLNDERLTYTDNSILFLKKNKVNWDLEQLSKSKFYY